jgi:hypothetical protein
MSRIVVVLFGAGLLIARVVGPGPTAAGWIDLLAPAFFLTGLWAASDVFARMHRGDAFGPAMVRGLREIGGCLMLGAVAAILVQPSLIFLIGNGFREMRGVQLDFSVENVTLALVGLVLFTLARYGHDLQAQLDSFV